MEFLTLQSETPISNGSATLMFLLAAALISPLVSAVTLEWSSLNCTYGTRQVLQSVSGAAASGRMLAIMGPSGSGKTTLLNALAGQIKWSKKASLTGTLLVDGEPAGGAGTAPGVRQAYVRQEDIFYTQMTVRETLMFAARLRLPSNVSIDEKRDVVNNLLRKLSLVKAADTIVGDAKRRGISGGERKRLSIGCELIGSPNLLFLVCRGRARTPAQRSRRLRGLSAVTALRHRRRTSPPPAWTPSRRSRWPP